MEFAQIEVFFAAETGNFNKIDDYISQGGDVNIMNTEGETLLMFAADYGHTEICRMLIAAGAKVDAQSEYEEITALMIAATCGFDDVCEILIDAGANINLYDFRNRTAFYYANKNNHTTLCKYLAEKGAVV